MEGGGGTTEEEAERSRRAAEEVKGVEASTAGEDKERDEEEVAVDSTEEGCGRGRGGGGSERGTGRCSDELCCECRLTTASEGVRLSAVLFLDGRSAIVLTASHHHARRTAQ